MTKSLQIFDPALCCNTGVCGVDADQTLISFAADVAWAKENGAQIERFNLAQQPLEFAQNLKVKNFLETSGQEALPVILLDDEVVLSGRYPSRDELSLWLELAVAPSLFTEQVAELIAIAAAIGSNCEPCFKYHYDLARKLGVSPQDMRYAVDLAQKVKDTPARAMLNLAERYLGPSMPDVSTPDTTQKAKEKAEGCCAATPVSIIKSAAKCC